MLGDCPMPIGTIISTPSVYSAYAQVRDEYGGEYTVHQSEISDDLDDGDEFAYRVDVWNNPSGTVTTLREFPFDGD